MLLGTYLQKSWAHLFAFYISIPACISILHVTPHFDGKPRSVENASICVLDCWWYVCIWEYLKVFSSLFLQLEEYILFSEILKVCFVVVTHAGWTFFCSNLLLLFTASASTCVHFRSFVSFCVECFKWKRFHLYFLSTDLLCQVSIEIR